MIKRRQSQKEQTKAHIIDIAIRHFARNGFVTTKTEDIAKEAGVAHGTVFVHFPTRNDLLTEVIEEVGTKITSQLHVLAVRGSSLKEILEAHLKGLMDFEMFYTRLVKEAHLLPKMARQTLMMIQSAISYHIIRVVEVEIETGKIKPLPLHLIFNTWIGLLHHYLSNNDLFAPESSIVTRYGRELLNYFQGLLKKE